MEKPKLVPKRKVLGSQQELSATAIATVEPIKINKRTLDEVSPDTPISLGNPTPEPDVEQDQEQDQDQDQDQDQEQEPASPEPTAADEECEQILAPQLQEILEYLADDEKVFLIKGSQLNAVASIIQSSLQLKEEINVISTKLHDLSELTAQVQRINNELNNLRDTNIKSLALATSQESILKSQVRTDNDVIIKKTGPTVSCSAPTPTSTPASTPRVAIPSVLKGRNAPPRQREKAPSSVARRGEKAPSSVARRGEKAPSSVAHHGNSIVDMLDKYKNYDTQEMKFDIDDAAKFNTFFDMIYILNMSGKGITLGETLQKFGITKCQIIDSDLPKKIQPFQKVFYYMRDAVESAKECNYQHVLILNDDVLPHKRFTVEFREIVHQFESGGNASDWDLIQCGFARKTNVNRPSPIVWEYYVEAYPGMGLTTEKDAVKHWKHKGCRDGRVAAREIFQDAEFTQMFAIALSSKIYTNMLAQLEIGINHSKTEHPVLKELKCVMYGVKPNLFIKMDPEIGSKVAEYKKYQWHLDSYLQI